MQMRTPTRSREGAAIKMRSITSAYTVPTRRRVAVDAVAVDVAMAVDEETVVATSPATIVD